MTGMKNRINSGLFMVAIVFMIILTSCKSGSKQDETNTNPNLHKVVVKEVLQVTQYTYLLVNENGADHWVAGPKMDAKVGDTYYYLNGMVMTNFASKDLNRTFESIVFVDKLSTEPITDPAAAGGNGNTMQNQGEMPAQGMDPNRQPQKPKIEKANVKIDKAAGGISIAELYAKKDSYADKKVIVKGQVTKVNNGIMGTNWVHIQDGTEHEGNLDLTITTAKEYKVGEVVTFEGKISLKKDYGYGYYYEVIMEGGYPK